MSIIVVAAPVFIDRSKGCYVSISLEEARCLLISNPYIPLIGDGKVADVLSSALNLDLALMDDLSSPFVELKGGDKVMVFNPYTLSDDDKVYKYYDWRISVGMFIPKHSDETNAPEVI